MRYKYFIVLASIFGLALFSCNENPAELSVQITSINTSIYAGEEVVFDIVGEADYITFYHGKDEMSSYKNYPASTGRVVVGSEFHMMYNSHGTFQATFITSSVGDWAKTELIKQFDFEIKVTDNRTGIIQYFVKTPGLFGDTYYATINEDNFTISLIVPSGTDISSLQTSVFTESVDAIVYHQGELFENLTRLDYSGDDLVFTAEAPDGTKLDWTVTLTEE